MSSSKSNLADLQMEELEREFDIEEFKTVVGGLVQALQLHINVELRELYQQIKNKNGKVLGKDIFRLLHLLKREVEQQKQLDAQIQFYKLTIQQLVIQGKNTLTIGEFFVNFVLNNPKKGIVTQQIQDKIGEYKIISMSKLMGLIQSIQKIRSTESRILKSHIHNQLIKQQQEDTLDITTHQIFELEKIRTIIMESCIDQNINSKAIIMLDSVKRKMLDDLEQIQRLDTNIKIYQGRQQRVNDQLYKLEQIIQEKENMINRIYQENEKYEEEIKLFQEKCREDFSEAISKLSEENGKLTQEKMKIAQTFEEISKELEWYKANYMGVSEQYKKFVAENQLEKERIQIDQNNKNFEIMKEEINEIYEKMNKLRKQNLELKNRISDLQIELESRVMTSGHQTDRTFINLTLEDRFFNHSHQHEDSKETFLQLLRKKPHIQEIEQQICKSISQQRNNSIKLIRSVTKQYFENEVKLSAFNNKQAKQKIQQAVEQHMSEQIKQKIDEYDFAGILNSKQLKSFSTFLQATCKTPSMLKSIFSTKACIINSNGQKQKVILAISTQKLLLCRQNPLQAKISVQLGKISQFCICQGIRNWIVVKIKDPKLKTNNKPSQIVLEVRNRAELLKYFLKSKFISSEHNIRINFMKEESIQVRENSKSLNLANFEGMKNLIENSVNDGENVFEGKMHQYFTFINLRVPVLLIVNPIGILIFEKNQKSQVFEHEKLKTILPFTNKMQIIDLSQQNKLKIVYSPIKKSHVLEFDNYATTKLIKQRIKIQREALEEYQKKQKDKFLSIFTGFNKMRSIDQQSSVQF